MEEEVDENTDLELISEYNKSHRLNRMCHLIFTTLLSFFTVDPFAIYKSSSYSRSNAARYQQYQLVTLKIQPNHLDRLFRKWQCFIHLVSGYLFIKFTAIVVVQSSLPRTSYSSHGVTMIEKHQEQRLIVSFGHLLGNPFVALPGVTLFTFGLLAAVLAYTVLYLFQHRYSREPFDSAKLRLWLEPAREFKRQDLIILQTLDNFGRPLERYCICRIGGNRRQYSVAHQNHDLMVSREIQAQVISMFKSGLWHLRPINYTFDWYRRFNECIFNVAAPVILTITTFCSLALQPLLSFLLTDANTGELILARLSFHQKLTFMELTLSSNFIILMALIHIVISVSLFYSQSLLLDDIRCQLEACLDKLRRMNCGQTVDDDKLTVNYILLGPLLKTLLSVKELRNNVRFLSEMVSINVIVSSSSCIFIQLAGHLDGEQLAYFRYFFAMFHWLWANLVLISCAHIYTRAAKMEPIIWSILAELRSRELRCDLLLFEFHLAESWRRLILSRCFSDPLVSVRPFGITLNYDRALQLNYLAISFSIILKSF